MPILYTYILESSKKLTEIAMETAQAPTPVGSDRLPGINEIILNRYIIKQIIGDGGYGTVLAVIDDVTKKNYAIKTEKYSRSMLHIGIFQIYDLLCCTVFRSCCASICSWPSMQTFCSNHWSSKLSLCLFRLLMMFAISGICKTWICFRGNVSSWSWPS